MKKYKIDYSDSIKCRGSDLYRIIAIKDFGKVKEGDKGGYIEREENLSHTGDCWIGDNAKVYGTALVSDDAQVYGDAQVSGNAFIYNDAKVYENARVSDNAQVYGDALVYGNSRVYENSTVSEYAEVFGNAIISGSAYIHGRANVFDYAWVYADARIKENSRVYGNARVKDSVIVTDNACVCGSVKLEGSSVISGENKIVHGNNVLFASIGPCSITITPDNVVLGNIKLTHLEFRNFRIENMAGVTITQKELDNYKSFLNIWEKQQELTIN